MKTILIVDDDRNMADLLRVTFETRGFSVTLAHNGTEALRLMGQTHYDIILLDLLMPEKDGFQVLEEKKATASQQTPVFVITNLGQEHDISRAEKLGAQKCFVKAQTSPMEVLRCIREELAMEGEK
jgi:two-component system response regulator VicR